MKIEIRTIRSDDRIWVTKVLTKRWGNTKIVTRGKVHQADRLSGFIAEIKGKPVGVVTYKIEERDLEIVTLDSFQEKKGVGTKLLEAVKKLAKRRGCRRIWVITTNDNLKALGFYQKRGFQLVAVYRNALEESRRLKPQIPLTGKNGIPLRDEIKLEYACD